MNSSDTSTPEKSPERPPGHPTPGRPQLLRPVIKPNDGCGIASFAAPSPAGGGCSPIADGGLRLPPLPRGDTHDSGHGMQDFVRSHMTSILRPMAEHVRELQQQVQLLSKTSAATDAKAEQTRSIVQHHGEDLLSLKSGIAHTSGRVDKTQIEVSMGERARNALETEFETMKSAMEKFDARIQAAASTVKVTQQQLAHVDAHFQIVQGNVSKTNAALEDQTKKLRHLETDFQGLNTRQVDMLATVADISRSGVATDNALKQWSRTFGDIDKERSSRVERLAEWVTNLERDLNSNGRALQKHVDSVKPLRDDVAVLKDLLEHSHDDGCHVSNKIADILDNNRQIREILREHAKRMTQAESGIVETNENLGKEKTSVQEQLQDIRSRMHTNNVTQEELKDVHDKLADGITTSEKLLGKCVKEQKDFVERLGTTETDIRNLHSALHTDTASQLDRHASDIRTAQTEMQKLGKEIGASKENIQHLKGEIAATNVVVSKLGSRYDSCNQTIQSMNKGIQDTYRHVVLGEEGMLAPRVGPGNGQGLP
eukprot:TRINITY_DN45527_c0_g1_i1.p1 TRINITY_DN45527_c0_g1~~TRINITY_DN45527_c0_g1_i1.p1  ORF type:complete len:541 (+),score=96.00 TRINITY_DN45527_c0_g1_i1:101-1723(+)